MIYQPAPIPPELASLLAGSAPDDAARLAMAWQIAAAAHGGQLRDEGTPFVDHPLAVAVILWSELGCRDADVLCAALTHDVLEDSDVPEQLLRDLLGDRATAMVVDVTKVAVPEEQKAERDARYLASLRLLPHESRLLKLADRIHNLRCVPAGGDRAKAARYLDVSRREFYPLALATDARAADLIEQACDAIERHLAAPA